MMEKIIMKLAVIYHSETENTKQAAEWIADGMNEVSGVEARAFSIEKVGFCKGSKRNCSRFSFLYGTDDTADS